MKLRGVEPEDTDFIYECENDRAAGQWSDYKAPMTRAQLTDYALSYDADPFRAGQIRLIMEEDGTPAGILDFYDISATDSKAYLGICIHPDLRGKGLAKAGLEAARTFNRERLGLRMLLAKVSTRNKPGEKTFEGAGAEEICILPQWHKIGSEFHDFHLYLLKD